ncbi:MAG: nitrous oxide-stimulated promoter family protein [Candidatus Thorarchaeota archaeon]
MNDESKSVDVGPKIRKEKATVEKLIRLYCEKKHNSSEDLLCAECQSLLEYSNQRLDTCQFGEDKSSCRKCPVHCYRPTMRSEIRNVMRFSGPRIVFRAPAIWIRHKIHDREDVNSEK